MSLQFCDDFKGYGTTVSLMLDGLYAEIGNATVLIEDPDPNVTGTVLRSNVNGVNGTRVRRVLSADRTIAGFAVRVWLDQLPPDNQSTLAFSFSNSGNATMVHLAVGSTGSISIRRGDDFSAILATSDGPVLTANSWNHIEARFLAHEVTGTAEVRVNGVPVPGLDPVININTGTTYSQFRIDNPNAVAFTYAWYFKDLVVWDSLGTKNNNFFGTVSVLGRTTDSDTTLGGWVPSTGTTGWNLLDNSPPLDGTEYISADDTPPAAAVFGLTSLPVDITSVRALVAQTRVRKIDGGDGTFQVGLISNGDTGLGADRPLTTAFTYYEDIFENDPDTGGNWSPASAEAVTFQVDRTT